MLREIYEIENELVFYLNILNVLLICSEPPLSMVNPCYFAR